MKRLFDIFFSLVALLLLLPFFLVVAILISLDSKGGVFFIQTRVGRGGKDFGLYKFRSMVIDAEAKGQLTVGGRDPRVTKVGYVLRKYKLDELPQFLNVLKGEMSVVGPRPEVRKYVSLYNPQQQKVLSVRPGLTDYASIEYANENELLAQAADPEKEYIETIMPAKLQLNLKYVEEMSVATDLRIILKTIARVFF